MEMKTNDRSVNLEKLLLIAHLAHTEIHLGELIERTEYRAGAVKRVIQEQITVARKIRTQELESFGEKGRILWCSLKHLLLAYIHCHELAEKTGELEYYAKAAELMVAMDKLLANEMITEKNIAKCPRCDEV